ncbi:hypothetical protein [Paenibacillus sp.]|uniref:hypothetical protein n=1 Tax=Paenibacillus sp. TaxID=58172 RepID=UPI002D5DC422|nr:hypothetical protein [Paenibacillus sp.]HZG88377.1 hypothetical protein [Paenibacillus sp.]
MSDWKKPLRRRLFGLHPKKTAEYFRKLKHLQELETAKLRNRIAELAKEADSLREEAARLETELEERRSREAQFDAAGARLAQSKKALRALGELEADAVLAKMRAREEQSRKRLEQVEGQARTYEETFRDLLEELSEMLRKVERLEAMPDAQQAAQESDASLAEAAAAKARAEAEPEAASEPSPLERGEQELAALHQRAKVIQFKLRTIVEKQAPEEDLAQERALEKEKPAEREEPEERREEREEEPAAERELQAASSLGSVLPLAPARYVQRKREQSAPPTAKKTKPSTFWGDIHEYLDGSLEDEAYAAEERAESRSSEFFGSQTAKSAQTPHEASSTPAGSIAPSVPPPAVQPTAAAQPEPSASPPPAAAARVEQTDRAKSEPAGSSALSEEIVAIRNRYIVGKLAGEALYAHDGRLIAAKHQVITPQIVQDADREGKLPDLIVHMIVPSLSEGDRQ